MQGALERRGKRLGVPDLREELSAQVARHSDPFDVEDEKREAVVGLDAEGTKAEAYSDLEEH